LAFYKRSLRNRIFFSMILLILLASVLIAVVTVFQYREEAEDYHRERLERKEVNIRENIQYVLRNTTYPVETGNIPFIFKDKIYEIRDIHNLELYIYDLEGELLRSSRASFFKDTTNLCLSAQVLNRLRSQPDKRLVQEFTDADGQEYKTSYTYINDLYFKPIGILYLPYVENDDFINKELTENLTRLGLAYLIMLAIAVLLAYILSKYITRSLSKVTQRIIETRLNKRNTRIPLDGDSTEEIARLVQAYNSMIDELEESAAQLAAGEREAAWREMAKQVAHEIKNPLTPMRLTVQSFERKFDPADPDIREKLNEFTNTLIQQIDTMGSIAAAFSTYAQMPAQQDETLDVVKITKLALDIFNENYIRFSSNQEQLRAKFDRTQLIRVLTNLVKNSIQAIEQGGVNNPLVQVRVFADNGQVVIEVEDNGVGIPKENQHRVFEPKFTTKSSGMGLGLAMVKKIVETYGGSISFTSQVGKKTVFRVTFPSI